jgi:hypothetical protein
VTGAGGTTTVGFTALAEALGQRPGQGFGRNLQSAEMIMLAFSQFSGLRAFGCDIHICVYNYTQIMKSQIVFSECENRNLGRDFMKKIG